MQSAVMFSKASDEWATPQAFFDELDAEFNFAADLAATDENSKCDGCYLGGDHGDSLSSAWHELPGRDALWLNPPYSQCAEFIAKASREAILGCTVVCLVPSRTDTKWWHTYVWDQALYRPRPGVEIRFVKGRLKFGDSQNSAPFPSVVVIFRGPYARAL